MSYTVLDIETTGLSRYVHKITEIAAVRYKEGKIKKEFHTLVNPGVKIPKFITTLTGIDDKMVKDAPKIDEVLPDFLDFLEDTTIVAHNATFDYNFIDSNLMRHFDQNLKNKRICTVKLANRILADIGSKKLENVCKHFEIKNDNAHRAMSDVMATVEVFSNFLDILKEKGIEEHNQIINFERSPLKRCHDIICSDEDQK